MHNLAKLLILSVPVQVSDEIILLSEPLSALIANEGLLLSMNSEVIYKIPGLREDLVAVVVFTDKNSGILHALLRVRKDLVLVALQDFIVHHVMGRFTGIGITAFLHI